MELESKRAEYEQRGIHVAAASYDSVEILETFAERRGITFPLLADPDYRMIEAFDIVNDGVPEDAEYYGFAYAGYYMIDASGVVTAKFFNEQNNDRNTAASILVHELGADADGRQGKVENDHLTLQWSTSNATLRPGQRGVLVIDVELKPKMHVYAPGVEGGYIAIDWQIAEADGIEALAAAYPPSRDKHLPAIGETVPVYENELRVLRDVHLLGGRELPEVLQGRKEVVLEGGFKYQACDDKKCYRPTTIPMRWTFALEEHDLVRVPETIRRGSN